MCGHGPRPGLGGVGWGLRPQDNGGQHCLESAHPLCPGDTSLEFLQGAAGRGWPVGSAESGAWWREPHTAGAQGRVTPGLVPAGREFPSSFESLVKKICRYLFHVLAHIYSSHFRETLALELHGHLNTLYVHFILFAREFSLLDPKETAVMDDLTEALCAGGARGGGGGGPGAQNHVKER